MSRDTAYAADEPQPSSALDEQRAQSEREDGTPRGGADTADDQAAETTGAPETA